MKWKNVYMTLQKKQDIKVNAYNKIKFVLQEHRKNWKKLYPSVIVLW